MIRDPNWPFGCAPIGANVRCDVHVSKLFVAPSAAGRGDANSCTTPARFDWPLAPMRAMNPLIAIETPKLSPALALASAFTIVE